VGDRVEREHPLFELKTSTDLAEFSAKRGNAPRALELLSTVLAKLEPSDAPIVTRATRLRDSLSGS
jgi:hypothetical protein